MFAARVPVAAMGLTLTLHVVSALGRGYSAAGLVGTATMAGSALSSPLVGRMIDRFGLCPVVATCGTAATAYWISAPHLPYPVLVAIAFPAGGLAIPVSSIARQVLTALVPPEQRRSAYSLDSILLETAFMIGPAAGIAVATQVSSAAALTGIGLYFGAVTVALCWFNPPVRHEDETAGGHRPPLRGWLTSRLTATLCIATGALFCLAGMELAALAALRANGQVGLTGVLMVVMCVASAFGGLVHGAVRRSLSQATLMLLLAALTLPIGLFTEPWWLLAIALVPANVACAPTLTSGAEEVTSSVPARVRGEAMGLLDSATRLGLGLGSPLVGFVLDHSSAGWGFAASGAGGLAIAAAGLAQRLRVPRAAPVNA
ncbi:MFS transporter [Amycolatopsis sp. K13G38]|uniref:MFS transporter n=1 Tax=Amycolatopsis acididurans TaxID=2724524 RepID=A0ABX1J9W0_9PSEU|nr:MFS transporter [Amycolatopsis acididurans]NKQ55310.1 MFS transporter [Amycolatopsis acididurans]